jgi:hypothetical protein
MLDYYELFAYPDHFSLFLEASMDMNMKCVIKSDCNSRLKIVRTVRIHISNETA